MTTTSKARSNADWERIELDYRSGIKTLKEIAEQHGITAPAILKRAKRDSWTRDLSARIAEKAKAKVNAALVNAEVNEKRLLTERETVEANADRQARIEIGLRDDAVILRDATLALAKEHAACIGQADLLRQLGEILASGDEPRMRELYERAVSLPTRTKGMKDSVEAYVKAADHLIRVSRIDFGSAAAATGFEQLLEAMSAHAQ